MFLEVVIQMDLVIGLYNCCVFDDNFKWEWVIVLCEKFYMILIKVLLDGFDMFIEYYGSSVGDDCLIKVVKVLKEMVWCFVDIVVCIVLLEFVFLLFCIYEMGVEMISVYIQVVIEDFGIFCYKVGIGSGIIIVLVGVVCVVVDQIGILESLDVFLVVVDISVFKVWQEGGNQVKVILNVFGQFKMVV